MCNPSSSRRRLASAKARKTASSFIVVIWNHLVPCQEAASERSCAFAFDGRGCEECCAAIFHNEETAWPNTYSVNKPAVASCRPSNGDARESWQHGTLNLRLGLGAGAPNGHQAEVSNGNSRRKVRLMKTRHASRLQSIWFTNSCEQSIGWRGNDRS